MDSSGKPQDAHSRWCANRNTRIALAVTAFFALEVFLSWRGLGQTIPKSDTVSLFVSLFVIAWLVLLFVSFKCVRERLVLGLLIIRFAVGFAAEVAPAVFDSFYSGPGLWKRANLALWAVTLAVSLSMLYSSLRLRSRGRVN